MCKRDNNGSSTVPCGTPESTWVHENRLFYQCCSKYKLGGKMLFLH